MTKYELDIAYFLSFCIENYKTYVGMPGDAVMDLFDKYGVSEYLIDNFEVLHTQSPEWILADIDEYIENRRND